MNCRYHGVLWVYQKWPSRPIHEESAALIVILQCELFTKRLINFETIKPGVDHICIAN